MARNKIEDLNIENARLLFKNFSGTPDEYNSRGGIRKFGVVIDPDIVSTLLEEGWNIKKLDPKTADGEPLYYLTVKVQYGYRDPDIYIIPEGTEKDIEDCRLRNEDNVKQLDKEEIIMADVSISPYPWTVNGKSGVNAYLSVGYFTIKRNVFASKYEKKKTYIEE